MIVCPNCGNEAQDTAVFCDQCGTRLVDQEAGAAPASPELATAASEEPAAAAGDGLRCSACGYPNVPGELFCENCGIALDALEPEVAEGQVEAAAETPTPASGTCPACGATVGPGNDFCDNCGAALTPTGTATEAEEVPVGPTGAEAEAGPTVAGPRFIVADSGADIPLPAEAEILIGREDPVSGIFPDIDLTPHGGEEGGVSRKHVKIEVQDSKYTVQDLDSTNFTLLNRQRLTPFSPKPIQDGDELQLGRVQLVFKTL